MGGKMGEWGMAVEGGSVGVCGKEMRWERGRGIFQWRRGNGWIECCEWYRSVGTDLWARLWYTN